MIVLLHVLIALSSVAWTTHLYFSPTRRKFYAAYGFIGATLASGTYLVISTHSPLLSSCVTGLVYLGVVSSGVFAAHRKPLTKSNNLR
ncbi:MAG TPA: hypothetical protein VFH99_00050 [Candidatus Saccharimonadales bacterium]|nr:hypothetical protein [Candidatus Saccharimonadales bacterium]